MKIWKVILVTLVIFCAGVFAGVRVAEIREARHRAERHEHWSSKSGEHHFPGTNGLSAGTNRDGKLIMPFGRPPFRNMGKEFLERLERELKLDADQRKRIEKILDESQKRTRELWKQIEPEMREEMKKSRDLMREVLTPDQNKRFDELTKRAPKPPKDGQSTNNAPIPPSEQPSNPPAAEPPAKP